MPQVRRFGFASSDVRGVRYVSWPGGGERARQDREESGQEEGLCQKVDFGFPSEVLF